MKPKLRILIDFYCDNEAVVTVLNVQTSKTPYLLKVIRFIVLEQLKYNFTLTSKHIPGVTNILADKISLSGNVALVETIWDARYKNFHSRRPATKQLQLSKY